MQNQFRHNPLPAVLENRRDVFERDHIPGDGGEVLIPEPPRGVLVAHDAAHAVGAHELGLLLAGDVREALGEAGADDDHVAEFELDGLLLGDGLDVVDGDLVRVVGVEGAAGFVGVLFEVDEDAAGDHAAALVPVVERGEVLVRVPVGVVGLRELLGVGFGAVVAAAGRLVVEMDERVPLGAALGVELDLVVVAVGLQGGFFEVDDFVDKAFAAETRGFDGADGPVEGDVDAFFGFGVGCFDDVRG